MTVYFLYDVSMYRFIKNCKNSSLDDTLLNLAKASSVFLWFYRNMKSSKELQGYDLIKENNKFKLNLIFEGLSVEFRASWVNPLGQIIERFHNFEIPLHVSYYDVCNHEELLENIT